MISQRADRQVAGGLVFVVATFIAGHALGQAIGGGAGLQGSGPGGGMSIGGTVTGGTTGSVLFVGPWPVLAQDNPNFFLDDTNNQIGLGAGSTASPAYSFKGDPDTGFYNQGANSLAAVTGTVERSRWGANCYGTGIDGQCIQGTTTEVGLQIINNGGTRARVDVGRPDTGAEYAFFGMDVTTGVASIGVNGASSTNLTITTTQAASQIQINTAGTAAVYIDGTQQMIMQGDKNWVPATDNNGFLGTVTKRFKQLYAMLVIGALFATDTNCSSSASPAACGDAPAGNFTIAAGSTSVTVNTTAVGANSQIFLQFDSSLGTKLGVTCNTTFAAVPGVNARTAGTSFVAFLNAAPAVNPGCYSYFIINKS